MTNHDLPNLPDVQETLAEAFAPAVPPALKAHHEHAGSTYQLNHFQPQMNAWRGLADLLVAYGGPRYVVDGEHVVDSPLSTGLLTFAELGKEGSHRTGALHVFVPKSVRPAGLPYGAIRAYQTRKRLVGEAHSTAARQLVDGLGSIMVATYAVAPTEADLNPHTQHNRIIETPKPGLLEGIVHCISLQSDAGKIAYTKAHPELSVYGSPLEVFANLNDRSRRSHHHELTIQKPQRVDLPLPIHPNESKIDELWATTTKAQIDTTANAKRLLELITTAAPLRGRGE